MNKILDLEKLKEKNKDNLWIFDKARALTIAEVEKLTPVNIHSCFFDMTEPQYDKYIDKVVEAVIGDSSELDDLNHHVSIDFVRLCIAKTLRIDEDENAKSLESRLPSYMKKKARELKRKEVKKLEKQGFNIRNIATYIHTLTMVTGLQPILEILFSPAEIAKIQKEEFGIGKDFIRYVAQLTFGMVESEAKN